MTRDEAAAIMLGDPPATVIRFHFFDQYGNGDEVHGSLWPLEDCVVLNYPLDEATTLAYREPVAYAVLAPHTEGLCRLRVDFNSIERKALESCVATARSLALARKATRERGR